MTGKLGEPGSPIKRSREGSGRARLEEVARRAGVSTATVSRAFNLPDRVSPETRERIFSTAKALGWVPNAAGRALASNRTHIAGVIIPTLDNEIFSHQVGAMQRVFAEHGLNLLIACSNYDPDLGFLQAKAMIESGVEALALAGETHPQALYDNLDALRIPYVLTYAYRDGAPHAMVGFDNEAAFVQITDYLLGLGHRRFAVVMQPSDNNDRVLSRLRGINIALRNAGLTLAPKHLIIGKASLDFGISSAHQLIAEPAATRPTAIICGNDTLALGVQIGLTQAGADIPGDFSITGFDDIELASKLSPALTTMFVDNREIGTIAAQQLVLCLGKENAAPQSHQVMTVLRVRQTTAAPA
ncbi:LacI family transcriptional regulator [Allorhizobium taibaishanense]|uniref:LacI family transcriptional regulator n=1 Tax=Allorhizobium taibaishanense TaxID=887144 RepID=A0A1Q9A905_9HYPH|nr:LacI family transcriptional regulator [Allorhizobium taibaishanense]